VATYLPNITEHVATTPPELNILQSPQLFPNIKQPVGPPGRWSTQAPESYLPTPVGRWSQDTGSDNEILHKNSSLNQLPNPDLTDTSYLYQHQNKMNLPPSILENVQNQQMKDYQDNYRDYHTLARDYSEKDYNTTTIVGHMRPQYHHENTMIKESFYEKSRTLGYLGSRTGSPYMSKERVDMAYKNGNMNGVGYGQRSNNHSVQSLQVRMEFIAI
jgi:cadherin EGF LAG seven-pass G-type receptor 1